MKNEKGFFRSTYLFNNAAYFLFTLCFTGLNSLDATSQSYALHNNAWAEIESDEKIYIGGIIAPNNENYSQTSGEPKYYIENDSSFQKRFLLP